MRERLIKLTEKLFYREAHPRLFFVREAVRATIFPRELVGSRREFVLIYFIRLFFLVGRRLWNDNSPRQAAALSFQTLLSVVPLFILVLAASARLRLDIYVQEAVAFLESNLMPDAASAAAQQITTLAHSFRPGTLGLVGLFSLVVVALTLIFSVEKAINEIFRIPQQRAMWLRVGLSLLLIVVAPSALGVSLYLASQVLGHVSGSLRILLPLFISVLLLFLVYWLLPHRSIRKKHALVSALIAGIAMEALKWGFATYVSVARFTLVSVYGALAVLPLFLLWIYALWLFFLFGAQLNAALHEVRDQEALHKDASAATAASSH
ncbi:MAG: YihY/virulence factor BrkB family protein [Proteobacteria bacterium]|nr:YihY/virulence factor BrkB family protein [Pseudomonadota bacterium]